MKRALLAATAIMVSSFAPVTAAIAGHSTTNPIIDSSGKTMEEICLEALNPNYHADFTTTPVTTGDTDYVPTGMTRDAGAVSPEQRRKVGGPLATGVTQVFNTPYRNGGSPNLWVEGRADVTYAMEKLYNTEIEVRRTVTFMCDVTKRVGRNNVLVDPHGLESYGHQSIDTKWVAGPTVWRPDGTTTDIGVTVYVLACISPNNTTKGKPGEWVGKHGFTKAQCETFAATPNLPDVPSQNSPDSYTG
jgi:hypothetical protein